jgi:hypothetical protein
MSEITDTYTLTLSKERKGGRVIKTRPSSHKDYSNYYILWRYEYTRDVLKTFLNQPINFLIQELCELLDIQDENAYDFIGNYYLERETIDLKNIRWEIIDKYLFNRLNQTFNVTISPSKNNNDNLLKFDEILEWNKKPKISLEFKKTFTYEDNKDNIISSYEHLVSYLNQNKEKDKLNLIFKDFPSQIHKSSQKIDINSEKIILLKFLDSTSYTNFLFLYEILQIKSKELYIIFSFQIKDNLNLNDIFAISKLLPKPENEKINLHLKIKSPVTLSETIIPDYSKYSKKDNIKLISLEVDDQLLGFSKDFLLNKFLSDIYSIFNISNFECFYLKNSKFTFPINLYYVFYFLSLTKNSLKKIYLLDNKVEYEVGEIKDYFFIKENEGICINLNNEKIYLPVLDELVIINTKLLGISDLSKCSSIFINKNLKIDSSSFIHSEKEKVPVDKFTKIGRDSHLKINSNLGLNFFKGSKYIMSDLSELTLNNLTIDMDWISMNLFGSIIKNSDLHQIRKLNFSNCQVEGSNWLNNILENFSMSKLRSIKLREIYSVTYIDEFLFRNRSNTGNFEEYFYIDEFYVKDSYIDVKKFDKDFIQKLRKLKINKLRINLSNLFEINSDETFLYINKTMDLFKLFLSYSNIQNLILENEALQILQNFSITLEVKSNNIKNLILQEIKCKEPVINILDKINLYSNNICFINTPSQVFSNLILEDKIQLQDIYVDVKTINSQIFNQPNISNITTFFNIYIDKKDQDLKNQLITVEKNFSFLGILDELNKKQNSNNRKLNIFYKKSQEIFLLKVLYIIYKELQEKNSKLKDVIKSLLLDGNNSNSNELLRVDVIKNYFICDKQNLVKLGHRRDIKVSEILDFNFIKLK